MTVSLDNLPLWLRQIAVFAWVAALLTFPVILKFFLIFPERSPLLRRFPSMENHLHWPLYLIILFSFGLSTVARVFDLGPSVKWFLERRWVCWSGQAAAIACMAGGLAFLVVNYRAAGQAARRKLRVVAPKVDRWFFHQAYDAQQIIADLAESLRLTTSLPRLVEQVATKIQSALHTANVTILLRDEASGDYLSAYQCVYSFHNRSAMRSPCDGRLPRDFAAIARLAESGQPIDLDGRDPQFDLQSKNGDSSALSSEEREALQKLESALLLPIAGKEGLLGVVSLGPHLGDLPFSSEDKRLLFSVSGPASFALENSRLIERMIEEARRREEIEAENEARAKELEEARQLQLSMLPKQVPHLPGLEIAAYMKTATEVGGDYYDFHLSADGTLTVMVGDATGHGLKAGTVVTATKSLLNHLAASDDIPAILQQASRALKQMNLRGLFMAMTMVKLRGSRLSLSVAGMPPVLVYRAGDHRVEELELRGVPLGSVTSYAYREEVINLSAGDIVVLMSDGLPERFDAEGEMLGYGAAKEALLECAGAHPQQIIERFVQIGDAWGNGRPQDDDVTFVVMKKTATLGE
ncbi:MAG: PP2C family protein-serine/threonine phosphatase [Blastocatellia bacterium]